MRPHLAVARTGDGACRVDVYRAGGGWCGCCRRHRRAPAAPPAPLLSITAARGVGVQITGPRAARTFIPARDIRGVFVHEAWLHCRVVATLAIDTGAAKLTLPLEPAGFDVPLAQLGEAWRALAGALDLARNS